MSIGVYPYVVFMLMNTFVFNYDLTNACDFYIIEGKRREKGLYRNKSLHRENT
jgi:hypothetical protein